MKKKITRLENKYLEVAKDLLKEFGLKNINAVPKISKVVINMGIGEAVKDKAVLDQAVVDLKAISGQYPSIRKARLSVASFSLRKGMPVGLKVTLRRGKMYSFLDKLFSIVLPRLRDFRGLSLNSFDRNGNYTLGITEHTVFPEIDITKTRPRGLEVTIVTTAKSNTEAKRLLEMMGMPFEKRED